jgi:putative sigma-54 modulation protein
MEVTEALKQYAEQKAAKLSKYYDRIQEIEVILDASKDANSVEMIVNAEHNAMFIAHHGTGDAYACIDGCVDKLERQLTDHKERFRNRKHPDGPGTREGNTRQRTSQ